MASNNLFSNLFHLQLTTALLYISFGFTTAQISNMVPFNCSAQIKTCNSILYQKNSLSEEQIATYYSVNSSEIAPITHFTNQDYLVTVPCSCQNVNGTVGYFYDTRYTVQQNDTFFAVSSQIYSGQAWQVGDEQRTFVAGANVTMHLLCGCLESISQTVVTYTVQPQDTLVDIATLLSSEPSAIQSLNSQLLTSPGILVVGWVLFVPMNK